jgi:hypothetical protein
MDLTAEELGILHESSTKIAKTIQTTVTKQKESDEKALKTELELAASKAAAEAKATPIPFVDPLTGNILEYSTSNSASRKKTPKTIWTAQQQSANPPPVQQSENPSITGLHLTQRLKALSNLVAPPPKQEQISESKKKERSSRSRSSSRSSRRSH